MPGARCLVVGLDGATFDVLDPLLAEGRCPNLARLLREGVRSRLRSTIPPVTAPSWSSFLTGTGPGRHGLFDFTRRVPGTWRLELTNATHRRVPTIHRVLSDRGLRSASIAVPTTWPPDPIDGVVISGFDSPVATGIRGGHCHPRALYRELRSRFGGMAFADFQEIRIGPGWHEAALASLLSEIARKERISRWLLGRERWELFMVLFGESDTVSHHFWMFHDPRSPRFRDVPALRGAVRRVYQELDAALGRLLEAADPEVACVVSDHGFGGAGDLVLYLGRFLQRHGWLRYRGSSGAWGAGARTLALRHLPPAVQQALVRAAPPRLLGAVEAASRFRGIDLRRSRAVTGEMSYAPAIHLNVAGRDPGGVIQDRDAAASELRELLLSWRVEGRPAMARVWLREEIYRGAAVALAPDLVLEPALRDGYSPTLLPSIEVPAGTFHRHLEPHEYPGGRGRGMNGTHRARGLLILQGAGLRRGVQVDAGMADVAPTLLALLDQPVPGWCDGRVLRRALAGRRALWRDDLPGPRPPEHRLRGAQQREVEGRLRGLGYL